MIAVTLASSNSGPEAFFWMVSQPLTLERLEPLERLSRPPATLEFAGAMPKVHFPGALCRVMSLAIIVKSPLTVTRDGFRFRTAERVSGTFEVQGKSGTQHFHHPIHETRIEYQDDTRIVNPHSASNHERTQTRSHSRRTESNGEANRGLRLPCSGPKSIMSHLRR
jgi:hypothetical protein